MSVTIPKIAGVLFWFYYGILITRGRIYEFAKAGKNNNNDVENKGNGKIKLLLTYLLILVRSRPLSPL